MAQGSLAICGGVDAAHGGALCDLEGEIGAASTTSFSRQKLVLRGGARRGAHLGGSRVVGRLESAT
jgi:hypothetical protein